jgi:hypothetical protein
LRDQDDDLRATLVALDELSQLYPDTFKTLLLAAREALRPMDIEARLDGHTPAPIAVRSEVCACSRQFGSSAGAEQGVCTPGSKLPA